jgi:hypothetical protein
MKTDNRASNDIQYTTQKNMDRATSWNPLKTGGELRCSGRGIIHSTTRYGSPT